MSSANVRIFGGLLWLAMALLPGAAQGQAGADATTAKARVLSQVQPEYPEAARRAGAEGIVVARIRVDANGDVRGVTIRRSPHESLSDAAEAALRKWKFQPPERDGKPVGFTAQYEFEFHLRDALPLIGSSNPPPSAEESGKYIATSSGVDSLRTEYWNAKSHKAFASSDEGSWGWSGNMLSADGASEQARANCERHRAARDRPCKVVNVDGKWVAGAARQPKPLRLLPANDISVFRRHAIEEWPGQRKARALGFLDQCRRDAEAFLEILPSNDASRLYAAISQDLREQVTRAEFDAQLVEMKRMVGVVTSTSFMDQALVVAKRDTESLEQLHSEIVFTATTTLPTASPLLLVMTLTTEAGQCRVSSFAYVGFGAQAPPWLREGDVPSRGT